MTTKPSSRAPLVAMRILFAAALLAVALAASAVATAEVGDAGPGTLSLSFVDAAGDPVTGACVEIWKGDYEEKAAELCNTGGSSVRQLPQGSYVIHESQPPILPHTYRKTADRTFGINSAQTTSVSLRHDRGAVIDAVALRPDGSSAYACFSARAVGIGTVGPIEDTACSSGAARLYVGAPATISVSQDSGPVGYVFGSDLVDTTLDGRHTATIRMRVATGALAIEQRDTNGALIEGGCYSLFVDPSAGPEEFLTNVCDDEDGASDGVVTATALAPGHYRFEEDSAPDGYQLGTGPTTAVVGSSEVRIVRTHAPLPELNVVTTTAGGTALAGSCWRVYSPDQHEGWNAEACDAEDGKADGTTHLGALPAGEYELLHYSAPAGFVRIDEFMPFTMSGADLTLTYALAGTVAPANTAPPAIHGDPESGLTLTSTRGEWTGTGPMSFVYGWQRCDAAGEGCAPIPAAFDDEYTVSLADAGHTLRLSITARNGAGTATAISAATAPVVAGEPINTVAPSVSGIVSVGRTLTGRAGTWTNEPTGYAYQWLRCTNVGETCAPIPGANALTYVLTLDDAGASFRLAVTASNGAGSATARSLPTAVLKTYPPLNETPPTVLVLLRSLAVGTTGTWVSGYGEISYGYQWLRCDAVGESCAPIPGATASAYVVPASDTQFRLRLQVFATNTNGTATEVSAAGTLLGPRPPVNTKLPSIDGELGVGRKLSAGKGSWESAAGKIGYAYQWLRCDAAGEACEPIEGATKDSYRPVFDDGGHRLRVRVIASNSEGASEADSAATAVVVLHPAVNLIPPSLDGTVRLGQTLSTNLGRWDWEGDARIRFDVQWQRCANVIFESCTDIEGATRTEYRLTMDDVGYRLRVLVWGDIGEGATLAMSQQSAVLELHPAVNQIPPSVDGDMFIGQKLSTNLGRWDWEGDARIHFDVQWQRCANLIFESCTDIPGATRAEYRLTLEDVGYRIRVLVWGDIGEGRTLATSEQSAVLELHPPVNVIVPSVDGTVMVGDTLSTNLGRWDWDGPSLIHFNLQWQRCTVSIVPVCSDIEGATRTEYRPTIVDGGHRIRVLVWGDNGEGRTLAVSGLSAVLVLYPPVNQIVPSVDGTLTVGETLSTNLGRWDWEGRTMIHFDVQWQRCTNAIAPVCTDIPGATRTEYRLTMEDVGYRIRVRVWGDNEQGVTLAESNLTNVLTLRPPTNVIRPSIDGTLTVGKTVETNSGRWEFEGFIHFAYQWQRCDADGTHCVAIAGATKWNYKLTAEDRGKRLVLAVWGDNGQGSTLAESYLSGIVQ